MKKTLPIIFLTTLVIFAVVSFFVGFTSHFDGHDALFFLEQGRRVSDPAFSLHKFTWFRPRGLVLCLSLFDMAFHRLSGHFPDITDYHGLIWAILVAAIVVWTKTIREILGKSTGWLTGTLLCVSPLIVADSFKILSDGLTTLAWGLTSWLFFVICRTNDIKKNNRLALLMGLAGALTSLAKYQFFFILPCLMTLVWFSALGWVPGIHSHSFKKFPLPRVLLSWVIGVDLVQRIMGDWYHGIWYNISLYAKLATGQPGTVQTPSPATTYLVDFYQSFGPGLFLILGAVFVFKITKRKARPDSTSFPLTDEHKIWFMTNLAFLVFHQILWHREPRYLMPLLPVVLAVIAWFLNESLRKSKWVYAVALVALVIHPVKQDVATFKTQIANNTAWEDAHHEALWEFLGSQTEKCQTVLACQTELDQTHYSYFLPEIPNHVSFCWRNEGNHRTTLIKQPRLGDCLVMASSEDPSPFQNPVTVQKMLATHLNETGMTKLRSTSKAPGEIRCEPESTGGYFCYREKNFFTPKTRYLSRL